MASHSPISEVLASCRGAFWGVGLMSGLINVLMLTGSLFMMQVYDRVLASHSVPTLIALSLIALCAYLFQGWLDILRSRILTLIGERIDEEIGPRLHAAVLELPLRVPRLASEALQPFRDLEAIRGFMASTGPLALFDLSWMPIYLFVIYLLHPLLGYVTLGGAAFLMLLTLATELRGRGPTRAAVEATSVRNQMADVAQRGAESVRAMGMLPVMTERWREAHDAAMIHQRKSSYVVGGLSAVARMFRFSLQSAMLATGAYLAILGELSAGGIIAGSIISARALAPVDQAIASWKAFISARQSHGRLKQLMSYAQSNPITFELPPPTKSLAVLGLAVPAPGSRQPIVSRVSFTLNAGQALGVIGPSASGKTTLARALVGVWKPLAGAVTLDGASLDQWDPASLGPSIGYLSQDTELFDGTIAQNIARFRRDAPPEMVIEAARAVGMHDVIVGLPQGYDTRTGQGGIHLSAGQRQRIGVARALFGRPFLVVLDEPNANLDAEGDAAVGEAVRKVRERGGIAVIIAHRPSAIASVDMLLVMKDGQMAAFGPRDEVLARTVQNAHNIIQHPAARASEAAFSRAGKSSGDA